MWLNLQQFINKYTFFSINFQFIIILYQLIFNIFQTKGWNTEAN